MMIIGCDFHPSWQQVSWLDTETGETGEQKLVQASGDAERFYRQVAAPALIGMEATGNCHWLVDLLAELGHELWVGDAAQIRASYVRQQKTDKRDAAHILKLLVEGRFPRIWMPSSEVRDLRQLLLHRYKLVIMRARVKNELQHLCLNKGVQRKHKLWSQAGQQIHTVRPVTKTQSSVQVLVRSHAATGKTASPRHRLDLQSQVQKADGDIAVDGALELQGEDTLEVTLGARHKGASSLRRRHPEAAIELSQVVLPQEAIGLGQGGASGQPQLLRQASLPGSEVALTAAPRLRRIRRDHANPEFAQRPSHLGQAMRIHRFSRLRSQPEVAAAIAVQSAE